MAWYVHAVEGDDGQWSCRHGLTVYDAHSELADAVEHLREIGDELGPGTELFVHYRDGPVDTVLAPSDQSRPPTIAE